MNWNYEHIKQLAKENGGTIKDYIALSQQRDPFYVGTETQMERAQWFLDIWQKYGYNTGVHLRRIHYQVVSQETPVKTHDGQPYGNTEKSWQYLSGSALYARYLGFVDPSCFVDRRAGAPLEKYAPEGNSIDIDIDDDDMYFAISLPDMPQLPRYTTELKVDQPYHIEIWTEKSTMNDVIIPLCSRYNVNLLNGVGEISITHCEMLVQRIKYNWKPCRIFYVSDFDPGGQSMPVAAARKIEYFVRKHDLNQDIEVTPVVLTKQQCVDYKLPRTPIKESETRGAVFEEKHGEGATELDALEALYPGELRKTLEKHILQHYDTRLSYKIDDTRGHINAQLHEIWNAVIDKYEGEYNDLNSQYHEFKNSIEERADELQDKIDDLYSRMKNDMQARMPEYDVDVLPEPEISGGDGKPLYSSERTYVAQIQAYKQFQNNGF